MMKKTVLALAVCAGLASVNCGAVEGPTVSTPPNASSGGPAYPPVISYMEVNSIVGKGGTFGHLVVNGSLITPQMGINLCMGVDAANVSKPDGSEFYLKSGNNKLKIKATKMNGGDIYPIPQYGGGSNCRPISGDVELDLSVVGEIPAPGRYTGEVKGSFNIPGTSQTATVSEVIGVTAIQNVQPPKVTYTELAKADYNDVVFGTLTIEPSKPKLLQQRVCIWTSAEQATTDGTGDLFMTGTTDSTKKMRIRATTDSGATVGIGNPESASTCRRVDDSLVLNLRPVGSAAASGRYTGTLYLKTTGK
ncbi:hypothetical protein RD136_004583 [Salmonella enterica]|nr:hypothetical protein [Salmonella enterica]